MGKTSMICLLHTIWSISRRLYVVNSNQKKKEGMKVKRLCLLYTLTLNVLKWTSKVNRIYYSDMETLLKDFRPVARP